MAKGYKMGQSGGGINKTLPYQLTAFTAVADNTPQITLSWENPTEYWAGTLIVKKAGSAPEGVNDGEKIYNGTGTSFVDTAVEYDTEYFYRAFPYNAKKQYQTEVLTVSAMPRSGLLVSTLPVGSLIKANFDGVGTNFLVTQQGLPSDIYDDSCNGTWALFKDCCEERQWHSSSINDYENSTIHSYLNGDFLNKFDANIQSLIKQVKIPYRKGSGYGTTVASGANGLTAKIFLLSTKEVNAYSKLSDGSCLSYFENCGTGACEKRIAYLNNTAVDWWLRSPYCSSSTGAERADRIQYDGNCPSNSVTSKYGIRPAFILFSDALVDPTPNADGSYNLIG